jgi:hypothetical protein
MTTSTDAPHRAGLPSREPGRLPRIYLAVWGLMAGFALLYLALLAIQPQLAEQIVTRRTDGRNIAPLASDIEALRRTTASLEREMEALRTDLGRRDAQQSTVLARLTALEMQPRPPEVTETAAPVHRVAATAAPEGQILKGATIQGNVEEKQPPARARASEARATASDTRSATPVGVHVASGPSVDALKLSWRLLQDGHKATLKSLEPRWVEIPGNPSVYALVAGPINKADEAGKICERLAAKRVACSVVTFNGQPL